MKTKWTTYYNGAQTTFRANLDDPKNEELIKKFYNDFYKDANTIKVELFGDIHSGNVYIKVSDYLFPKGINDYWIPSEPPADAALLDRKFYN